VNEVFLTLLYGKSDKDRLRAVWYLYSKAKSPGDLLRLLQSYQAAGEYYYNVVALLDIFLFAPVSVRDRFANDLRDKVLS
jgi:hypothetical protein